MAVARMGAAAWRLLTDVRFAVVLITLLALSGLVGMLIRQFPITAADDPARYAVELESVRAAWDGLPAGSFLVDAFDAIGFFSVFSTPWFLLLMTVLVISIICCTLDRTPRLWRSVSHVRVEQPAAFFDSGGGSPGPRAPASSQPTSVRYSSSLKPAVAYGMPLFG